MSIWASLPAPDDTDHEDDCEIWIKHDHYWEFSGKECTCGTPSAPIIYKGSHILPEKDSERGGNVSIALIPPHVRWWRENPEADNADEPDYPDPPDPYLRLGVNEDTVILDVDNVKLVYESLGVWLESVTGERPGPMNEFTVDRHEEEE